MVPDLVTAVLVHYGTPDLTRAAVWSLRGHYPALPVLLVENASPDGSGPLVHALAAEAGGVTVLEPGRHLHHGPGLDFAIHMATTPWVLLLDSDAITFRAGVVERLLAAATGAADGEAGAYMAGRVQTMDADGFDVAPDAVGAAPYVHPHCALVHRETYLTLPPFAKHGSPCLANERAALARGLALVHVPVGEHVLHVGEGTVRRYGYQLGAASRWARLRFLARRALGR